LRTVLELRHHSLVLLIEFVASKILLDHFLLPPRVHIGQLRCPFQYLDFQHLLALFLIFDVGTRSKPFDDLSFRVSRGIGSS
jgi:hypothetical protein